VPTDVLSSDDDDDDETIESVWIPVCVLLAVIIAAPIALLRRVRAHPYSLKDRREREE